MSLQERIERDFLAALKAREELRVSTLRMVKTALKHREVAEMRSLTDADVIDVLKGLIKQRREAIEQYRQGGRADLAEKEAREIEILEGYLPAPLSDAEIERIVVETIAELGAKTLKDLGPVMKAVMAKLAGQLVEGRRVNEIVRAKLSSPEA
ncbi:MAG: GatB/YqeY domain-containing protein [Blastocatellia bacterium]|nr:GatB/YqeY domain-containing protein [Blastocatellia bacterium]MCS7157906.1 GatB/YqeY domain-containing protein [Blastocatellia bacterium]MCX7753357.1 GatB/YqeY domain-containing protein [Blastocatellia bacterium]MDW8168016.1 GatB/YqeY domain-containing protein [Acidobacteriota bacterium]MDW8255756.1 GatB/YqeY domain-containing protein [Acidobacteriota bacterium]